MTQTSQSPGDSQEQPGAVSSTGTEQGGVPNEFAIGAFNEPGVNIKQVIQDRREQKPQVQVQTQQQTPAQVQPQPKGILETKQPTAKDERHFADTIRKQAEKAYDLARLAVEADADAIYDIAERDPELAGRLLKDYEFGVTTVEELIEKKTVTNSENPEQTQKEIETARRMQNMEKELLDEKILRLRGENPDLSGELEAKFREMYSDPAFAKYTVEQKMEFARTLTGQTQTQTNADDVALAVLKQEEGVVVSPRGSTQVDINKSESPEFKKMKQQMGVSDEDLKLLPPDIDDILNQAYGLGR